MIVRVLAGAALAASAAHAAVQQPATQGQSEPVRSVAAAVSDDNREAARRFVDLIMPADVLERMAAAMARIAHAEDATDQDAVRRDRHFAERTRLTRAAVAAEATRFMREVDPEVRSMLVGFYARHLGSAELREAIAFYESPVGARFATEATALLEDEEYLRSAQSIDANYERVWERAAERIAESTAHLPPFPEDPDAEADPGPTERRAARPAPAPASPAGSASDPVRVAAAERAVEAMWPDELLGRPVNFVPAIEVFLAMRVGEFGLPIPPEANVSGDATVAEAIVSFDPAFRERALIAARIFGEELARSSRETAPEYRSILAAGYARHFTAEEMDAVAGFYATPAGRRIMASSYEALDDPDFLRSTARIAVRAVTQFADMAARVQAATAHLPPPPRPRGPHRRRDRGERERGRE